MIISASRRCDIPSQYGNWFVNRLKEGYVITKNPYSDTQFRKIPLNKNTVDIIVFWTKNPIPFLKHLKTIDKLGYKYYFQFTITPYEKDIEKNLPNKNTLIDTFIKMSQKLGKNKLIWRYDPILINDKYNLNYHTQKFKQMCQKLNGYTDRCIISFVDNYKNVSTRMGYNVDYKMTLSNVEKIVTLFSLIAKENNIDLYTCSESFDLSKYNVKHASCIDKDIIETILNKNIKKLTAKNQRKNCLCLDSIDIGSYNTCNNNCGYCYATTDLEKTNININNHNENEPVITGTIPENAIIKDYSKPTIVDNQLTLF